MQQVAALQVFLHEDKIDFGQDLPFIENGRTLVPIRFIAEKMDVQVNWVPQHEMVQLTSDYLEVELYLGKTVAKVNENLTPLDVAPKLVNGRTFVPLRFISEALGAKVIWEPKTDSILIYKNEDAFYQR